MISVEELKIIEDLNYKTVYLATMTRSGTWYCHYMFENLETGLREGHIINQNHNLNILEGIKCIKAHTHSIFPDFLKLYQGPYRQKWVQLQFPNSGMNHGHVYVDYYPVLFSRIKNPNLIVIYLYRNPLDNMVSSFHHYKNHTSETVRTYTDKISGIKNIFESPSEFMRKGGLEGYIKQYFTFHSLRGYENSYHFCYEDLVREPFKTFSQILNKIGFYPSTIQEHEAIARAVRLSSPENLRQIELAKGSSLADDQLIPGGSTMHGGAIGKWKSELDSDDIEYCFSKLHEFGISNDEFIFE